MEGFLLGLASGVTCLAYCAPILVPYMLGEGRNIGQNYAILGQFLGGRLVGYLLFGLFSWLAGLALLQTASYHGIIFGSAYILLAGLLAVYGLFKAPSLCAQEPLRNALSRLLARRPALIPFSSGLLTGLNLCPPFLLAFARAAESGSLLDSLLLFLAFFVGTALYFLPIPFLGALRRVAALRTIGKLTALIVALYYLIIGVATLVGNLPHPAPRHGDYPPPSIAFDHRPRAGPTLGASTAGRVSRCTEAGGRSAQRGAAYRYGEQKPLPSMRASSAPPPECSGAAEPALVDGRMGYRRIRVLLRLRFVRLFQGGFVLHSADALAKVADRLADGLAQGRELHRPKDQEQDAQHDEQFRPTESSKHGLLLHLG